jgi:catechol 2,3-dioxygenase-like lactoylglutathione lyase family enzyme
MMAEIKNGVPEGDELSGNITAITLFIENVATSKEFYGRVFGASLLYEDDVAIVFKFANTILNLLTNVAAGELIEPALAGTSRTGARHVLTIEVGDVDSSAAMLAARGVAFLNGPINRPWGIRTISFLDPDGHIFELSGPIPSAPPPPR